jgi:hypothetical protein
MAFSGWNNNLSYNIIWLEQRKLVVIRGALAEVVNETVMLCFSFLDAVGVTLHPNGYKV